MSGTRENPVVVSDSEDDELPVLDIDQTMRLREAVRTVDHTVAADAIKKGANLANLDEGGLSAVHDAMTHDPSPEMLRRVLRRGLNANLHGKFADDPLHYAVSHMITRRKEKVETLLGAGADLDAVDRFGRTTLDVARAHNMTDTLNLLLARQANFGIEAIRDLDIRDPDVVQLRVAVRGASPQSIESLFQPSCRDPDFLERLAETYRDRAICKKTTPPQIRKITGVLIGQLMSPPPAEGRLAVFKAKFECRKVVVVDDIKMLAWYRWAPMMLTSALRLAKLEIHTPAQLNKSDFATEAGWQKYARLNNPVRVLAEELDVTGADFDQNYAPGYGRKFESLEEAKNRACAAYRTGQVLITFFRAGNERRGFYAVVIFDTSLITWYGSGRLRAIDTSVRIWRSKTDTSLASGHAMIMDVAEKRLAPFDTNFRGLQSIAAKEPQVKRGYCQTWSRLRLETITLGAPDWTKRVVDAYRTGQDGATLGRFKSLFGETTPLTTFIVCIVLRYADAMARALCRLQMRHFAQQTAVKTKEEWARNYSAADAQLYDEAYAYVASSERQQQIDIDDLFALLDSDDDLPLEDMYRAHKDKRSRTEPPK
jgi:hypothetical protein